MTFSQCQKQEKVPCDDITRSFLKSASEINWERCKSFCDELHEDGADEENAFCLSSVWTGESNKVLSYD